MSLTLGLNAAVSGLQTAQSGLDLVSRNIANVNTPGYSRKIFNQESVVLAGTGAGVQSGTITRQIDQNLMKDLRKEGGTYSKLKVLDDFYSRVQDLWGKPGSNTSVSHIINRLSKDLETLAVTPNATTEQSSSVDSAVRMTDKLNKMSTDIQSLRLNADKALETAVAAVNKHLANISDLNDKIVYSTATNQTGTADLQDKRDLALLELSKLMDVQSFERTNGAIVVFSSGGTALVDSTAVTMTHSAMTLITPAATHAGSDLNNTTVSNIDLTNDIGTGTIKALVDIRDNVLPDLQAEIDELSVTMMEKANQVHNRGVPYPQMKTSYTGTRKFLASSTQTMNLAAGDDTSITLVDSTGTQFATTTLDTIMQVAYGAGDSAAKVSSGTWTINEVAAHIQGWLAANVTGSTAAVNADGNLAISVNSTAYSLQFHDEAATAANSTPEDVVIAYDMDADGTSDRSISGFANFFGLNDLFTSSQKNWVWDTNIMSSSATIGTAGTLNFSDETGGLVMGTLAVATTDTLTSIAANINASATLSASFEAEVIPEGSGYRLRVKHKSGEEISITQAGGTALTTALGLTKSPVGESQYIKVRSDIVANPQLISRGQVQYSTDKSEYYVSNGDNTNANALADLFTNNSSFGLAGDLSAATQTFEDYATSILSLNSTQASNFQSELDYQRGLTERLELKKGEISEVNLDEELSQLMIYEQSYAAAGKVISTISKMLDILNGLIR